MKTYMIPEISVHFRKNVVCDSEKVTSAETAVNIFRAIEEYNDNFEYKEMFYCMYLNRANKVISVIRISEGSTSATIVDIKKVLQPAIMQEASGIIVSHNHPSGQLMQSGEDERLTKQIQSACKIFDIKLLDHIILTTEGYVSFAEKELI